MGFTKVDGACETDMKKSRSNNDKDACSPNSASEPKSDSSKSINCSSRVGGTTEGLGDDLPEEHDESEDVTSSDPEVCLVSWHQLLEVRKTKFSLYDPCQYPTAATRQGQRKATTYWGDPPAQGMRGKNGNDNTENDEDRTSKGQEGKSERWYKRNHLFKICVSGET